MALTPEQEQYLRSFDPSTLQYGDSGGTLANGMHAVGYGNGYVDEGGYHGDAGASGGYSAFDPAHQSVGDLMYDYSPQGQFSGAHKITPENGTAKDLALGIATIVAAYFGANAAFGGVGGALADGTGSGLDFSQGFTDSGTIGGAADVNGSPLLSGGVGDATNLNYVNGSDVMSDSFDSMGGNGPGGFGGGDGSVPDVTSADYRNGMDINSDAATRTGIAPAGSVNAGVNVGTGPFFNTSPLQLTFDPGTTAGTFGLKPSDAVKLITAAVNAGGKTGGGSGSGGSGGTAAQQPFDYGAARWTPPGWRNDRPMYVPGQDAIPAGWYGAGYTQG